MAAPARKPLADRPHAPETGGPLARLLGPFHVTGVFWYRFHLWGVRVAPRWSVPPLVLLFTSLFYVVLRRVRRAIASNLTAVLGPAGRLENERRIFRTMHTFAWCLTERYESLSGARPFDVRIENEACWQGATRDGRGCIVLTGHLGNWEVGSAMPVALEGRTVHLVREEELDPRAQAFVRELLRERMGERYHSHFASDDPRLALELREALRQGAIVALQGDRPRSRGKALTIELFGRPFDIPEGPLALARAAGASVLPVFMLRTGRWRYRLQLGEGIDVAQSADRRADLEVAARRYASALAQAIAEAPHQWFCFRPLWKDPEGPRGTG